MRKAIITMVVAYNIYIPIQFRIKPITFDPDQNQLLKYPNFKTK